MSFHISGNSFLCQNVYIQSTGTTAGLLESKGPLGSYFDQHYPNHHIGYPSYEQAEIAMLQDALYYALKKAKKKKSDIDIFFGGDLNNQMSATHYLARDLPRPVIASYGACATLGLSIIQAALWIENHIVDNAIAMTVSHNATAERQFRYPLEYGVQRKETMTFTATGGVAVYLSNQKSRIQVTALTLGQVIDYQQSDPNDMGRAMAPAAFDTYLHHLQDLKRKGTYYDVILTGDLSRYGQAIMESLCHQQQLFYHQYLDCGCLLYRNDQEVNQGGSGPVCSGLVTFGYIYQKMLEGLYQKVLVLTTGALLTPVMTNQKQSIPCVCHAFALEVVS